MLALVIGTAPALSPCSAGPSTEDDARSLLFVPLLLNLPVVCCQFLGFYVLPLQCRRSSSTSTSLVPPLPKFDARISLLSMPCARIRLPTASRFLTLSIAEWHLFAVAVSSAARIDSVPRAGPSVVSSIGVKCY